MPNNNHLNDGTDLFVYGTLLDPERVLEITGRQFETRDAVIEGYYIAASGRTGYFELRERPDARATGKVLLNMDSGSLRRLDDYEGELYVRGKAHATIPGSNDSIMVGVYLPRLEIRPWLVWVLLLVGGRPIYELPKNPQGLREKCKGSLTSVSIALAMNIGILAAFLLSLDRATRPGWSFPDVLTALATLVIFFLLCRLTAGFTKRLWLSAVVALAVSVAASPLNAWLLSALRAASLVDALGLSHGSLNAWLLSALRAAAVAILSMCSLLLALAFELYDSGLNPHLTPLSLQNLEYAASRFYFSALWFTVLAIGIFVLSLMPVIGIAVLIAWFVSLRFVVHFEAALGV